MNPYQQPNQNHQQHPQQQPPPQYPQYSSSAYPGYVYQNQQPPPPPSHAYQQQQQQPPFQQHPHHVNHYHHQHQPPLYPPTASGIPMTNGVNSIPSYDPTTTTSSYHHANVPLSIATAASSASSASLVQPRQPQPTFATMSAPSPISSAPPSMTTSLVDLQSIPQVYDITNFATETTIKLLSQYLSDVMKQSDITHPPGSTKATRFHARTIPSIDIQTYLSRILKYAPTGNETFLGMLAYLDVLAGIVGIAAAKKKTEALAKLNGEMTIANSRQWNSSSSSIRRPSKMEMDIPSLSPLESPSHSRSHSSVEGVAPTTTIPEKKLVTYSCRHSHRSFPDLPIYITSYNIHRLLVTGVMVAMKFYSDVFYTNTHMSKVGGLPVAELNQLELEFLLCLDFSLLNEIEELQSYGQFLLNYAFQKGNTELLGLESGNNGPSNHYGRGPSSSSSNSSSATHSPHHSRKNSSSHYYSSNTSSSAYYGSGGGGGGGGANDNSGDGGNDGSARTSGIQRGNFTNNMNNKSHINEFDYDRTTSTFSSPSSSQASSLTTSPIHHRQGYPIPPKRVELINTNPSSNTQRLTIRTSSRSHTPSTDGHSSQSHTSSISSTPENQYQTAQSSPFIVVNEGVNELGARIQYLAPFGEKEKIGQIQSGLKRDSSVDTVYYV